MRISGQGTIDTMPATRPADVNLKNPTVEKVTKPVEVAKKIELKSTGTQASETIRLVDREVSKEQLQQAVTAMNELLAGQNSASKFQYHEGLNRYYVTVVDKETEEIIKEIPPKKLLDAFYEMQKMVGMIVDEKI